MNFANPGDYNEESTGNLTATVRRAFSSSNAELSAKEEKEIVRTILKDEIGSVKM